MKRIFLRITAAFTVFLFTFSQIASAAEWQQVRPGQYQPVEEFSETQPAPEPSYNDFQDADDFLSDTLSLTPVEEESEAVSEALPYDYERYEFEDALEQLRPEYASAVIVKSLTEENLKALTNLSFEVAIIVLHGETVLFTSGSEDEIGVLPAAKELLKKASFISHTHPNIHSTEGPSGQDLNEADETEYVITDSRVYSYSRNGIEGEGTYEWYLEQLQEALLESAERNQVEARKDLNQFIAAQDAYNNEEAETRETFRRGGTLSPASGLTAANVSTLAGSPYPYLLATSTAATTLSHSAGLFSLGYSVPSAGNTSGFNISFDNASTTTVETQNISLISNLVLGLKGPNASVSLEIVDIGGNKDTWTLTSISNTAEQFWSIPTASIANTLNKTKIKQINFVIGQSNTTSTTRTGSFVIRINGLNVNAPAQPIVTSAIPVSTKQTTLVLSGTKEANTAVFINGTQAVALNNTSTWSATVNLTVEGNNTFNITAKNTIGLSSTAKTVSLLRDTTVPTGSININSGSLQTSNQAVTLNLSAADGGSGIDKMSFSTDNVNWATQENYAASKTFTLPAGDGNKTVYVKFFDKAGNVSSVFSKAIKLDTTVPSGLVSINNDKSFTSLRTVTLSLLSADAVSGLDQMRISLDAGVTWGVWETLAASKNVTLPDGTGLKEVRYQLRDKAGNIATYSDTITYFLNSRTLADGTQLFYTSGLLTRERLSSGDEIYYAADGRVDKYRYTDGREVRYAADGTLGLYAASGAFLETLSIPTVPVLDETQALKLTLQDGVEAYYINGAPVEFRTSTGIRVTSFKLNAQNEITDALITYPDGTREIIRNKTLVRRIGNDGSVMDFVPSGFGVREILSSGTQYYDYDKTSQTAFSGLRIFTAAGDYSKYDNLGILREAGKTGTRFLYNRTTDASGNFETRLDTLLSSVSAAKGMVYAKYTAQGVMLQTKLQDGTALNFANGKLSEVRDALNVLQASYDYSGADAALKVVRGSATFLYDNKGFLETIKTGNNTIERTAVDTDGDGLLTDEQTIQLLLEEAGGNHLSDFELDSQGRILNGILVTKEGIKQKIENGVLTGFETVDGKVYGMRNIANGGREAYLKEWKFKDGTKIVYGSSTITEILFPDNRKLIDIGFDSQKKIQDYKEVSTEIVSGQTVTTTKIYHAVSGAAGDQPVMRLAEMTRGGVRIIYGFDGMALSITLADGTLQNISYERNEQGVLQKIIFEEAHARREYAPNGELLGLLSQGVSAEIAGNEIQKLYTRFGSTENPPVFDANGVVTGDFKFTDDTKLSVVNGQLVKAVRANGTIIHFMAGRMDRIEIPAKQNVPAQSFKLLYDGAALNGEDAIRVRLESEPGQPEMPLVPFLQKPETLLDWAQGGSVPNHPITFLGDAKINNTGAKMGDGSVSLDGAGDYLTVDHDPSFVFGSGNWTLDTWVKFDQQAAEYAIFQMGGHLNGGIEIHRHAGINRWDIFIGGNNVFSFNTTIASGAWTHIALVRDGGTLRFFENGIQKASMSAATVSITNTGKIFLGQNGSSQQFFPGKLDELRLSSGARWSSNFTPPAQAYESDASTKLLLHFDPPVQQVSSAAVAAEELSQILLSRPLYNSLEDRFRVKSIFNLDEEVTGSGIHELAMYGNARLDTSIKKTGDGSAAFDGSGDYLNVSHTAALELGQDDWTVDFWAEFDQQAAEYSLFRNGDHLNGGIQINRHAGINRWDIFVAGNKVISVNSSITTGAWTHIALVRTGSRLKFFQNGVQLADIDASGSNVTYAGPLSIGSNAGQYHFLPGRIDELRISKGIARWSSSFTPPAAEYTRDDKTALLLHFSQEEWTARKEILPPPPQEEGEDNGIEIFFAKRTLDMEREQTYEFATKYLPEWLNVSLNESGASGAWLEQGNQIDSGDSLADLTSALLDMDGDGLLDRVTAVTGANYWWVQKNNGQAFEKAEKWTGVDISWGSWVLRETAGPHPIFYTDLADMNGDGRPDRIMTKVNDPVWKVQFNNGHGFDAAVNWTGQTQVLSFYTNEGKYAIESRYNRFGGDIQDRQSALIDMDGDGRADRIVRPTPIDGADPMPHWFFQRNNGSGFDDAVLWKGVDWTFYPQNTGLYSWDVKAIGASMNWQYLPQTGPQDLMTTVADLVDMNGDGKPDRILLKNESAGNLNSAFDWYVQWNNGKGFDAPVLFDNDVRVVSGFTMSSGQNNAAMGSALQVFDHISTTRELVVDLMDVTGDGKPDRVTMKARPNGAAQNSWWVEVNNGTTFLPAVEWTGIEGADGIETAIGQDNDLYRTNRGDYSNCLRVSPCSFTRSTDLRDLNGDHILDRIVYPAGSSKWKVQFGTGSGFLPSQEMEIEGLIADSEAVRSSRYDYLHVSLKAAANITPQNGVVKISIGDKPAAGQPPGNYQEWTVTALGNEWKDFYLPVNKNQPDAASVKIKFEAVGADPDIPIYVDNMTFTSVRPPAQEDWLDRLLTEKSVLADLYSERSQTLAQYLGFTEAENTVSLNWDNLLTAETLIQFNSAGEAQKVNTFAGAQSDIVNGQVTRTVLNGTTVTYAAPSANTSTQAIVNGTSTTLNNLSYGKVRTVSRPAGTPLEYTYEFCGSTASALVCEGLAGGTEITAVLDRDSGITERYNGEKLVSRLKSNGVETLFRYDAQGMLAGSQIAYKGRARESFEYGKTEEGLTTLKTEDGVVEEYDAQGQIKFHTTSEGFRFAHSFAEGTKPALGTSTEILVLSNGTQIPVTVPKVIRVADPSGAQVHRIQLTQYIGSNGQRAEYHESGILKELSVPMDDGSLQMNFERVEVRETTNPGSGEVKREVVLLDAEIIHPDGTKTVFENGVPVNVVSATGRVINLIKENGLFVNGSESAEFHDAQAVKLWNELVKPKWDEFRLPGNLAIQTEYTVDGKMATRTMAEGAVELYNENGKIEQILASDGERLVSYSYDIDGNPIAIQMEGSRRRLTSAVLRLRADVAAEREKSLLYVYERDTVLHETIDGEYWTIRDNLMHIRERIEAERTKLMAINVRGKVGRELVGGAMIQINVGLDQVNAALEQVANQRADALKQLNQQVAQANAQIETNTQQALANIETENQKARRAILQQELAPVIHHWYRKILGRDPSQTEYDRWINTVNYDAGTFNLNALKTDSVIEAERVLRKAEVDQIKAKVDADLRAYLTKNQADKIAFARALGLTAENDSYLVSLTQDDVNKILAWINGASLHFGQSAFIALEALLGASKPLRLELASKLILIDILTGTITSLEKEDLLISTYAMRLVAAKYGIQIKAYGMTYDALKAVYDEVCPPAAACNFKLVVHMSGNHYIIVTGVSGTEVKYIDPGAGPENALQQAIMTKEEFLSAWENSQAAEWADAEGLSVGFGFVLSSRGPPAQLVQLPDQKPQFYELSVPRQMTVRAAFFPVIFIIIAAIIKFVIAIVTAVVAAISAIITGLSAAVGSILQGFGTFFSGLFTGNFMTAMSGLFNGIIGAIGNVIGGVINGVVAFGNTFWATFTAGGFMSPVSGVAGSFKAAFAGFSLKATAIGFAKASFISLAMDSSARLLDAMGVSPKITQTLMAGGKITLGVAMLATGNPAGIAFLGGGTSEMLSLHTNLSPTVSGIIGLGAAALGAFAGGAINTGSIGGSLAGLKAALPHLSMDLAGYGFSAAGNAIGLDPRLTSLISVPLRATVGSMTVSIDGYQNVLSNITTNTIGGLVSVGANLVLDELGVPPIASNFISNFLGQLTVGGASGGGSPGDSESFGKGILNAVGEGLQKFGRAIGSVVGNVVSFGQKVIEGVGNFTVQGFKKAVNAFSSMFSRETQEGIYADETNLRQATITQNGNTWTWQSGSSRIDYDTQTGQISESFGIGGTAKISNLGQDQSGKSYYSSVDYKTVVADGFELKQSYKDGGLQYWTYGLINEEVLLTAKCNSSLSCMTQNGGIGNVGIEIKTPPINIPGPGPDPQSEPTPFLFDNLFLKFNILDGKIAEASVEVVPAADAPAQSDLRLDKTLFVATNGIGFDSDDVASDYMENLRADLFGQSDPRIDPVKDIIIAPTFDLSDVLKSALTNTFGAIQALQIIQKIKNVWDWYQTQKLGGNTNSIFDLRQSIKGLADAQGVEVYSRDIVGVGYSGGFAQIVHALSNGEFTPQAFVALGGVTAWVGTKLAELLVKVVENFEQFITVRNDIVRAFTQASIGLLGTFLKGPLGIVADTADVLLHQIDEWYDAVDKQALDAKIAQFYQTLQLVVAPQFGYNWTNLAASNVGLVVNVYGDKDPLAIGNLFAGHLDELGGYTAIDRNRALFNIRIKGANHYDYINGVYDYADSQDITRNEFISKFVAQIILHSNTVEELETYLNTRPFGAAITQSVPNTFNYTIDLGF